MAKLSNQSNNKPILRRQKGWYGFVHGYNDFIKNVDWDKIEFDGKSGAKEKNTDVMGKTIYKY